jgi:hypothetical protein
VSLEARRRLRERAAQREVRAHEVLGQHAALTSLLQDKA